MDPPLDFRAVYTTAGAQKFVELSWQVSVGAIGSSHALYVGFMTPGDVGSTQVIRFRLPAVGAAAPAASGIFYQCNGTDGDCSGECEDGSTTPTCTKKSAWYEIYKYKELCDKDGATPTVNCDCTFGYSGFTNATRFEGAGDIPEWIGMHDTAAAHTTALRSSAYYTSDPSGRWTFRLRVPVDESGGVLDLKKGVIPGTQIWYEAPLDLTGAPLSSPHQQWPRLDPHGACFPDNDSLHFEMPNPSSGSPVFGDVVLVDPSYNPGFSPVSSLPAGCGGVSIVAQDLHVIGPPPGNIPGNTIYGDVSGSRFTNEFHATVHNDSPNPVLLNTLQAKFRLADWGVEPGGSGWPDFTTGVWDDVPATDSTTNPALNSSQIDPGNSLDLTMKWTLSNADITKYGLGASGGGTNSHHQCMLVELSGAATSGGGGNIDFSNRSAYTNMEFGSMSTFEQFAKIAAGSGYGGHDVYLVLMGKNTPEKIQANGREYITGNMFQKEWELKGLYGGFAYGGFNYAGEQVNNQDVPELNWNSPLLPGWMELAYLERVRQGRVSKEAQEKMSALVDEMRLNLSVPTISDILPAFEVYAYVDTGETYSSGHTTHHVLAPLTSFGYDLWHDGAMSGFSQVIDNAQKIGPNVYRVRTDKDGNAIIRVRSSSDEQLVSDPIVCGGCCQKNCPTHVGLNNTMPALIAGCFLFGRRRKKKQRS
jgi:hypothetical protein